MERWFIQRKTMGTKVMRVALEINFALWGMILCAIMKFYGS